MKKIKKPPCAGEGVFDIICTRSPERVERLIFEKRVDTKTCLMKKTWNSKCLCESFKQRIARFKTQKSFSESLILAQNERW